jgi:hypothetical protein
MLLPNAMSRGSLVRTFAGLAVSLVLVLWCVQGWTAGAAYAGVFAIATLFVTVLYAFARTQAEARGEAEQAFSRAAGGLRQRIESVESLVALTRTEWEKRLKLLESLGADVTRLETSLNEMLAAEREARSNAIEDALKGENAGRMEALGNELAQAQATLKEIRLDAVRSTLEETKKRVGELFATTSELGETLRAEKQEREDAIEKALEAEGDLRAKAIQTAASELLDALEAERLERVSAFERAVRSFGAAVAGEAPKDAEGSDVAVPPEEDFEPIRVENEESPEEAELRGVEPEAEAENERGGEPVAVSVAEAPAPEPPAAEGPPPEDSRHKGKKGKHRGRG